VIRPLGDRLFVRPLARPTQTKSGLAIPETAWRPSFVGRVTAAGPKVRDVQPADVVVYGLNNGQEHTLDGDPVLVMREADVLMILERTA
jgi:chaperonin GroES